MEKRRNEEMEEWRKEEGEKRGGRELSDWVIMGDDRISSRVDTDGEAMWKCEDGTPKVEVM